MPPGAIPPGVIPPGAIPPGAVPPGGVPPGSVAISVSAEEKEAIDRVSVLCLHNESKKTFMFLVAITLKGL